MSADSRIRSGGGRWSVSCRQPHPLLILLQILSPETLHTIGEAFLHETIVHAKTVADLHTLDHRRHFPLIFGGDPGQLRRIHLS